MARTVLAPHLRHSADREVSELIIDLAATVSFKVEQLTGTPDHAAIRDELIRELKRVLEDFDKACVTYGDNKETMGDVTISIDGKNL